jgi:hypothetical protein
MTTNQICTKCLLIGSTPGINFDKNGVCNYCETYTHMEVQGEVKLKKYLDSVRGTGEKYDCIVGISGGRDSTYTLWKLVNDYKMRVLALNYINPFTSEQAKENMQKALNILGVDLITYKFPNDIHRKSTQKALKAWAYRPSSIMIPIVCTYCKLWDGQQYRIAKDNKISLIIIGSNPLETASFKKSGLGGARTYHRISNLPKIISKSLKELVKNPNYLISCKWSTVIKMFLMAGHTSPYLRSKYKDISVLRIFDYIKWEEKEILSIIENNLGWRKSTECASSWRFDCRLDFVRRKMYSTTIGVSELRDLFSKLIREGQMTREEAMDRLKTEDYVPIDVVNDVLDNIGLKLADLNL